MKPRLLAILAAAALAAPPASAQAESEGQPSAAETGVEAPAPDTSERAPSGRVERGGFTTAVVEREPVDSITTLSNDHGRVFYFSELRDLEGESVAHRWEFDGAVMAEVAFEVGGPRWRVYSSKALEPSWLGEWTVSVIDASGRVLAHDALSYTALQAEATPAAPPAAAEAPPAQADAPPAAAAPAASIPPDAGALPPTELAPEGETQPPTALEP